MIDPTIVTWIIIIFGVKFKTVNSTSRRIRIAVERNTECYELNSTAYLFTTKQSRQSNPLVIHTTVITNSKLLHTVNHLSNLIEILFANWQKIMLSCIRYLAENRNSNWKNIEEKAENRNNGSCKQRSD